MKKIIEMLANERRRPSEIVYKSGPAGELSVSISADLPNFIAAVSTMIKMVHNRADEEDKLFIEEAFKGFFVEGLLFDDEKLSAKAEEIAKKWKSKK